MSELHRLTRDLWGRVGVNDNFNLSSHSCMNGLYFCSLTARLPACLSVCPPLNMTRPHGQCRQQQTKNIFINLDLTGEDEAHDSWTQYTRRLSPCTQPNSSHQSYHYPLCFIINDIINHIVILISLSITHTLTRGNTSDSCLKQAQCSLRVNTARDTCLTANYKQTTNKLQSIAVHLAGQATATDGCSFSEQVT